MVPNGWKVLKLEELEGGDRPIVKAGPFGSSLKKDFYTESGYKIYGQEQVIAGDAFIGDYYIDNERYLSLKSCAVEPGDILISLVGTIGKVLLIPDNAEPGIINPRLLRISLNKNQMNSVFFKYFLESQPTVNRLTSLAQGGTMGVLNAATLKALKIPVPPLPEQQKIAKILTTWDKAINTTERLIENSKQQKKALMQQLLTGQKRLLDDSGQRFSGDWVEVKLGDIGKCISGLTYSPSDVEESGLLVLRSSNIQNGVLAFEDNVYVRPDVKLKSRTKEGDILICVRNGSKNLIGKSAIIKGRAVNQAHGAFMIVYRSKYPNYVFHLFQSDLYYRQVNKNLGATINSINTGDLNEFKFIMPSNSKEIEKIAAVLTNADREIEVLEQQLSYLQQEKKALMQQLLTGKRRVKVD